jgi:hypothetical protein
MKPNDNPIICGRRNCVACGRWLHTVDFKWRWNYRRRNVKPGEKAKNGIKTKRLKSRYPTPIVDTVCRRCRSDMEKTRYRSLPPERKRERAQRSNANTRLRKQKLEEQIRYARMAHRNHSRNYVDNESYEITPFRMWLLRQVRMIGTVESFATSYGLDAREVRRFCDGFIWEGTRGLSSGWDGCEPTPIQSVTLSTVDRYGVAVDDPGLLDRLYPYAEAQ